MKKEYLFPCGQCGSKLKFSPKDGELKCTYCAHINIIVRDSTNIIEKDYKKAIYQLNNISDKPPVQNKTVKCKSCAAVFDMSHNVHSSTCPYCSSAIVNNTKLYRPIKPQGLLPFKVTKKEAKDIFKKWLKSLWFAPNKLKKYAGENSTLEGIYIPYWTYDANSYSTFRGRRGDKYYEDEYYMELINGHNERRVRSIEKISWSSVSGDLNKVFDDTLVMATSSLKHKLINWDLENLVDYDESYLSGYESEVYSIELDEGLIGAKQQMDIAIRHDIRGKIGGDIQEITFLNSQFSNITFKHILLPIYASAFKFNNKIYSYVVNGRNGDISGDRPYSVVKITFAVLTAALIAGTIYYLNRYN